MAKSTAVVKGTIAELADNTLIAGVKLSVTEWSVITRFLQAAGRARIVGEQKPDSGKGRTSKVWSVDARVELNIGAVS